MNGDTAHPLFKHLKAATADKEPIKWNFAKFLVDQDGTVVKRYAPTAEPASFAPDIEGLLRK